jgi:tetratricopeptide (TPR) repeat protein
MLIGRDLDADLRLRDPTVSRRHARISVAGDTALVEDLSSTAGILLNGQPISAPRVLGGGDVLTLGRTKIRFDPSPQKATQLIPLRQAPEAVPSSHIAAGPHPPAQAGSGAAEAAYAQAKGMYQAGDAAGAKAILFAALQRDPAHLACRFALGLCAARLGEFVLARDSFAAVLAAEPTHHMAAYHLGCAHQALGAPAAAVDAFRQALRYADLPDARARLAQCEDALTARPPLAASRLPIPAAPPQAPATPVNPHAAQPPAGGPAASSPGAGPAQPPRSLAEALDTPGAHAGPFRETTLQAMRGKQFADRRRVLRSYGGKWLIVAALVVTGIVASSNGSDLQASNVGGPPAGMAPVAPFLLAAVISLGIAVAALSTRYVLYERRLEISKGVLHRQRRYVWLYDVNDLTISRGPMMLLTNTAQITLQYDDSGGRSGQAAIIGWGTAAAMHELYDQLQERVVWERRAMKKQFI